MLNGISPVSFTGKANNNKTAKKAAIAGGVVVAAAAAATAVAYAKGKPGDIQGIKAVLPRIKDGFNVLLQSAKGSLEKVSAKFSKVAEKTAEEAEKVAEVVTEAVEKNA